MNTAGAHPDHLNDLSQRIYGVTSTALLDDAAADSKQKHLCKYCHTNPGGDGDHGVTANLPAEVNTLARIWDVADPPAADNGVFDQGAAETCAAADCHYSTATPAWYSGTSATCTTCHNNGTDNGVLTNAWPDLGGDTTGDHYHHFNQIPAAVLTDCSACHSGLQPNTDFSDIVSVSSHIDGDRFGDTSISATFDDKTAGAPAYGGGSDDATCAGTVLLQEGLRHERGRLLVPVDDVLDDVLVLDRRVGLEQQRPESETDLALSRRSYLVVMQLRLQARLLQDVGDLGAQGCCTGRSAGPRSTPAFGPPGGRELGTPPARPHSRRPPRCSGSSTRAAWPDRSEHRRTRRTRSRVRRLTTSAMPEGASESLRPAGDAAWIPGVRSARRIGSAMSQNTERAGSSKNGSRNTDAGSGIRSMSLSLIFWNPFTDEPSKAKPVRNVSSSTTSVGTVRCWSVPSRSTNLRSRKPDLLFADHLHDVTRRGTLISAHQRPPITTESSDRARRSIC